MIDVYRQRRGYNFRCLYWKRDASSPMDNERLVHENAPSGVFYARIASSKSSDVQDVAGVFRVGTEGVMLETQDFVDLAKDDLVQFDESIWIVGRVNAEATQRNAEFGRITSTRTTIELDKGN